MLNTNTAGRDLMARIRDQMIGGKQRNLSAEERCSSEMKVDNYTFQGRVIRTENHDLQQSIQNIKSRSHSQSTRDATHIQNGRIEEQFEDAYGNDKIDQQFNNFHDLQNSRSNNHQHINHFSDMMNVQLQSVQPKLSKNSGRKNHHQQMNKESRDNHEHFFIEKIQENNFLRQEATKQVVVVNHEENKNEVDQEDDDMDEQNNFSNHLTEDDFESLAQEDNYNFSNSKLHQQSRDNNQCEEEKEKNKEIEQDYQDIIKSDILQVIQELDLVAHQAKSEISTLQNNVLKISQENEQLKDYLQNQQHSTQEMQLILRDKQKAIDELRKQLENTQENQITNEQQESQERGRQQSNESDLYSLVRVIESLNENNKDLRRQNELLKMENERAIELARNAKRNSFLKDISFKLEKKQSDIPLQDNKQYHNHSNDIAIDNNRNNSSFWNEKRKLNFNNSCNYTSSTPTSSSSTLKKYKYLKPKKQ